MSTFQVSCSSSTEQHGKSRAIPSLLDARGDRLLPPYDLSHRPYFVGDYCDIAHGLSIKIVIISPYRYSEAIVSILVVTVDGRQKARQKICGCGS